jgi:hypothetical protein
VRTGYRVALLALLLAAVAAFAWDRLATRRERNRWEVPVRVAVLVLGEADPPAIEALDRALQALALGFAADLERYRAPMDGLPIAFDVVGPVRPDRLPPADAPGPSLLARAQHALDLWRATRAADEAAPGFEPLAYDVRIYLVAGSAGPDGRVSAEGLGDHGGDVGIVRATLDRRDGLLAATVVAHEALHCLGATDKYDEAGRAVPPGGLADPDLSPVYPQRRAEIMAGEVPLAPGRGRLPVHAGEIGIGPATAAEIGWSESGR